MKLYIYKRYTEQLELRNLLEVTTPNTVEFSRSTENQRQTVLTAIHTEGESLNKIAVGDIVLIETYNYPTFIAFVRNSVVNMRNNRVVELTLAFGADGIVEDVTIPLSSTRDEIVKELYESYSTLYRTYFPEPYEVLYGDPLVEDTTGYVRNTDSRLPFGQCIRQLFKQGYREQLQIYQVGTVSTFSLRYYKDPKEYEINLEDTIAAVVTVAPDTYTAYMILNEEDLSQNFVAFLYEDGSIGTDSSMVVNPDSVLWGSMIVKLEDFTQQYCIDLLKDQSYQNSISIKLTLETYTQKYILEGDNIFKSLGTVLTVWIDKDTNIKSNIEEVAIRGDIVSLRLGVAATRFVEKIKKNGGK